MANYNFTDFESKKESRGNGERARVGYFSSLKEDGDEAVIRLNYKTKADFKVVTVHRILLDGKWRNVECIKSLYDTKDKCPLCASGDKMKSKVFAQLLQYIKDEQGNITSEPKIWERGYVFVNEILDAIGDAVEDGKIAPNTPICDIVFKVKRIGAKGSLDTKYKLKVMQPAVVPENVFTKDFSAFTNFDSAHHDYFTKTAEELKYYVENKKFPEADTKEEKEEVKESVPVAESVPAAEPSPAVKSTAPATKPAEGKPATKPVNRYNW